MFKLIVRILSLEPSKNTDSGVANAKHWHQWILNVGENP